MTNFSSLSGRERNGVSLSFMADNYAHLKRRTQDFALQNILLVQNLPRNLTSSVLGKQLIRCSTSVGANYRAACRAKSAPDFISKMKIVEEESDECIYWLELLVQSQQITPEECAHLMDEANQLVAITVASIQTSRSKQK